MPDRAVASRARRIGSCRNYLPMVLTTSDFDRSLRGDRCTTFVMSKRMDVREQNSRVGQRVAYKAAQGSEATKILTGDRLFQPL